MITFELAKELKEAGYPLLYANHPDQIARYDFGNGLYGFAPTLSELIEACGDSISILMKYEKDWHAVSEGHPFSTMAEDRKQGHGSTPEEAVAKLWLALNKK